jgi:hypothetical protein
MNTPTRNTFAPNTADAGEAEKTLRLIASLPAPEGLEDRVKSGLQEFSRTGRVLHWPTSMRPRGGWMNNTMMRSAAAAAIVFVVVGGGWGVYSHVQPAQTPKVIAMPRVSAPGGFQSAGAMRTPQTLDRPVLKHPVKAATKQGVTPAASSQKPHLRVTAKGAAAKANRLPLEPPAN